MSNATLILIFSGLIAFVPNDARHPTFMTAYLMRDADHEAKLRILLSSLQDPNQCTPGCSEVEEDEIYCDCPLDDVGIGFTPSSEQRLGYIRSNPFDILPNDANALHLSWLVRLANVGGTNTPGGGGLEKKSVADVLFGWSSAATCALDEEKVSAKKRKVFTFDFVGGDPDRTPHAQALAELVVFRGGLSSRRLTIRLVSRSGKLKKELKLKCDDGVCPVAISNRASTYHGDCKKCEDCPEGEHFAYYYNLLTDSPTYRPLPYRRCGPKQQVEVDFPSATDCPNFDQLATEGRRAELWETLLAGELGQVTAVSNRVICPMAILDP